MRSLWTGLLVLLTVVLATAWYVTRSPAVQVRVGSVERAGVTDSLDEDGLVRSDVEVTLTPQLQGRLRRLAVTSGQRVRRGQTVASLDRRDLEAAVAAAVASEAAAAEALAQARARWQQQAGRNQADLRGARAGLAVAQAQLDKAERGSRVQEVRTARAALERARARREEALRELDRRRQLFARGFIPKADLESAQTNLTVQQAALVEAQQNLSLVEAGPRPEDRAVARGEVERATAQVEGARSQEALLESLAHEVEAAQARLANARAQVTQARATLEQGGLVAPADGIIDLEPVQIGELLGPTTPVARLIDPGRVWVEILVDENDRAKVKVGQQVKLICDAYPGTTFQGKLTRLDSMAFLKRELRNTPTQDEDRVFRARVDLDAPDSGLYPGMSVFAEIILNIKSDVLTIPREALVNREGRWLVLLAHNGRARERSIKVGRRDASRVEVTEGLQAGDRVVLNPGGLADGTSLKVEP